MDTGASDVLLFVGNISIHADDVALKRLFSCYGAVKSVAVVSNPEPHATVVYGSVDEADTAIAALNGRYCMSPSIPLVVMYHARSASVSAYGKSVSEEFRRAHREGRQLRLVPLVAFDAAFPRTTPVVPNDFATPPQPPNGAFFASYT